MPFALLNRVAAVFITLLAASATAQQDRPNIEYSADQTMEHAEGAMQGKIYYAPGKERREMNQGGMSMVNITRHDKKVVWMLMPDTKTYMEMPMGAQGKDNPGDLSNYKFEFTEAGQEKLNGIDTTKYKLIMTGKDGTKLGGFMWRTKEKIMVKMDAISVVEGGKMRIKQELTNLKIGKQDAQLFEIPQGYQAMSMAGMPAAGMPGADAGADMDDAHDSADAGDAPSAAKTDKPTSKPGLMDKLKNILRQ